ncbi:MAG: phosphatidylserine/phosphatidylglycerophosphate/cardiolipin synthase family protein [Pseudomonadota bacterium]
MAFWQFSPDTFLPPCTSLVGGALPGCYMVDLLKAIALLNIPVQLIAWYGTTGVNIFNHEMASNWATHKWVAAVNAQNNGVGGYRPIQIFMESYGGTTGVGKSTHQKIVIASTGAGGVKEAYVGGMNLAQKYLSSHVHSPVNSWHDTAVRVTGAIVDDIEAEWLRRWNKQNPAPTPNAAIGAAVAVGGGLTITMLTTDSEASPQQTDIRARMLTRIAGAAQFAYLENYAITDPQLVRALAAQRQAGIAVIPVVNHPRNTSQAGFEIFSYLMFYTYLELALANFNSFDAVDTWTSWLTRSPVNYPTAGVVGPVVRKLGFNPNATALFNPVNKLRLDYTTPSGAPKEVWFRDIWNIITTNPVMYGPQNNHAIVSDAWTYLHSKLALFDDRYVLIGTSNWTYRSMQYDGEITLEIDDATNAFPQAVRLALFNHWNMPTAAAVLTGAVGAGWITDANNNRGTLGTGANARVVPLAITDFIHPSSFEAWKKYATIGSAVVSAYM